MSPCKVSVLGDENDGGITGENIAVGKEGQLEGDEFSFRHLLLVSIKQPEGFWLSGNVH